MTDQAYREIAAKSWFEKAEDAYCEAEILEEKERLVGCVNRMYYSAFYAVSAVLAREGKAYGKHSTVRASLHRDFVKTGKVTLEIGKTYGELFDDRQEGDYTPKTSFNVEDVRRLMVETRKLIDYFKTQIA